MRWAKIAVKLEPQEPVCDVRLAGGPLADLWLAPKSTDLLRRGTTISSLVFYWHGPLTNHGLMNCLSASYFIFSRKDKSRQVTEKNTI